MGKLKDQLAGIAALIAAVVAIGGGFATYGKLTEKISVLILSLSSPYFAKPPPIATTAAINAAIPAS